MNALLKAVSDNLLKVVTGALTAGLIALVTYLFRAGSWTRGHQRARLFEDQGDKFFQAEMWEAAVEQFKLAVDIWEEEVNQSKMLPLYQKLGKAYNRAGEIDNALRSFMHCEVLWDAIKKEAKMEEVFFELSQTYLGKQDLERASHYIGKSVHLLRSQNSPRLPAALAMAARIAKESGRPEQAENNYIDAVRVLESVGDTLGLASVYYELAEIKVSQKATDLASRYYMKSIESYRNLGSTRAAEITEKLASIAVASPRS